MNRINLLLYITNLVLKSHTNLILFVLQNYSCLLLYFIKMMQYLLMRFFHLLELMNSFRIIESTKLVKLATKFLYRVPVFLLSLNVSLLAFLYIRLKFAVFLSQIIYILFHACAPRSPLLICYSHGS